MFENLDLIDRQLVELIKSTPEQLETIYNRDINIILEEMEN